VEKDQRSAVARQMLAELTLPSHFIMPLDSKWAASGLIVEKCRFVFARKKRFPHQSAHSGDKL
jgi:hypothetical protein